MKRKTQITLTVTLDKNNTPEAMEWSAPDGGVKAQFPAVWERFEKLVPTNERDNIPSYYLEKMI